MIYNQAVLLDFGQKEPFMRMFLLFAQSVLYKVAKFKKNSKKWMGECLNE